MQLRYRHIQLGILRIFEMQEFGFTFAQIHADQTHVTADAVIGMHDWIADFEFGQIAHHRLDLSGAFLLFLADAASRACI